ncbi:pyridine nucleotide-disulfide oxidoreductase [Alloprevotella sp. OH1205_COT-284]|uniref:FAD-dependent oxidoreductase n=1 Tax=Alloprevotella sp. OH1205_COT-284 TaxID=2491043 RepID=UPI000F5DE0C8|nr:FAD-dependent oxidoreductase [Alloprevotella sp. OH1205_COT-284]RRD80195.1 pyridine nucleotide-disulfide oxidoreductase [Alloprevotella sp. OH1205_COT-284]
MKHIIIGGVAGGATAAARIRRSDEFADIILLEKGKYISYANCGLPYYIGGTIAERDKLFLQTPESFGRRFAIDVRPENEAVAIDTAQKQVTVRRADGSQYTESYDKLLLSPGAVPVRPPLPGIDLPGIFTLRNVDDTDRIKQYIDRGGVKQAVVVGGGFIGLEMAENLHAAGIEVSLVEMGNQVLAPVDFSIASYAHQHLAERGVNLHLETAVERFEQNGDRLSVCLGDGRCIAADLVLLSIGVRPSTELAQMAGIALGERGIKVNEYLETSAKDVYAVGDAIEFTHPVTGKPWLNFLAGPANRQGRIVADNMVQGNHLTYEGSIGTAIAKIFDITVAATGLPAKALKREGIDYLSSTTQSGSHAGYYPGACPLTLKLTFSPTDGRIYGAQCVGTDGVDKRIDQIAQIIKRKGTLHDLLETEHCYAPPFSSAKDPVAIAAYTGMNILNGKMPVVYWHELQALARQTPEARKDTLLLDVRTAEEFALGTIEGATNIPLDDLRDRLDEVPRDKRIIIFCAIGLRGYLAQRILLSRGFSDVRNLSGGYKLYSTVTKHVSELCADACASAICAPCKPCGAPAAEVIKVDACGLQCPGPILQLKKAVDNAPVGAHLEVHATDPGFARDARAWCKSTGHELIGRREEKGTFIVEIEKRPSTSCIIGEPTRGKGKTFIMFSDDLDKALATFVLANGAAATGTPVSIFFTFWGLNVIKKENKPIVEKDIFGKMFSWMLPADSRSLHMSKMSMLGIGDRLMRHIMRRKGVSQLEELRQQALDNGVEFIACQMSMDMMGISSEELLDGVGIGGVATYMERAEQAGLNLFI